MAFIIYFTSLHTTVYSPEYLSFPNSNFLTKNSPSGHIILLPLSRHGHLVIFSHTQELMVFSHVYTSLPCMHMQSYRRHVHNLPYRRPYIHTQPTMYTAGKPTNCTNITLCMKRGNCKNVFLVRTIILIFTHALELSRAGFNP